MEVPLDDATSSSAAVNAADVGARDAATGAYYDRLARWTAVVARIGYGGGRRSLTAHRALADIHESIRELQYYRRTAFVADPGPSTSEIAAIAEELGTNGGDSDVIDSAAERPSG